MSFRTLLLAILMAAGSQTLSAQNIQTKAYMFGFVASFNDSTVYFTDIQEVDGVWVSKKKHYLAGKNNYSYQLRNFFTQERNLPHRTCVVVCSEKKKDVEKKYAKMKQQYIYKSKGSYDVRYLPESEFRFQAVDMSTNDPAPAEKTKKEKKQKPDGKRPPRDGKMPPPPNK